MVGVLIDSCGWVSVVDAGLNLDISLGAVVGESELKITDGVKRELDSLNKKRSSLLLDLLYRRAEVVKSEEKHTDDALLALSKKNSWPILTVDRDLKRRVVENRGRYIEVTSGGSLRLVGD
tara:strand:+ start:1286 stop:1648 length:363 start_codon:yes stop_codon:yes gene_type:complete